MAGFSGQLRNLIRVAERLAGLARVPSRAASRAAELLNEELEDEFAEGRDPYGEPWAALADSTLRRHGPPPLTETGDMRNATMAVTTAGAGLRLLSKKPAGIHQVGAARITPSGGEWVLPARPIFPDRARGLPDGWKSALDTATREAFGKGGR